MKPHAFSMFDTPLGRCGIAWSDGGVTGLQLPETGDARTQACLLRRSPDALPAPPTPQVQQAIDRVVALMQGRHDNLRDVVLDMSGVPAFHRRVFDVARAIGPGHTLTYGAVAARLGEPAASRAVGHALGRNPFAVIVPCHRVLAAGNRLGGFSAHGGAGTKRRLLLIEGASLNETLDLFDDAPPV